MGGPAERERGELKLGDCTTNYVDLVGRGALGQIHVAKESTDELATSDEEVTTIGRKACEPCPEVDAGSAHQTDVVLREGHRGAIRQQDIHTTPQVLLATVSGAEQ